MTEAQVDFDPKTTKARDASHFRRIVAARKAIAAADAELTAAVEAARAAGDSWTVIGMALDVSKQAAEQRFGRSGKVSSRRRSAARMAPPRKISAARKTAAATNAGSGGDR
jgi:hypothetical protein